MTGRACERCEWWQKVPDLPPEVERGECRAAPPAVLPMEDGVWPRTSPDDWCGMFRLREALAGGYDRRQA